MDEKFMVEWIWRKLKDHTTNIVRIPIRIPKEIQLPKGNYVIRIFKLESKYKKS